MDLFTGIFTYFLIWWLMIFAVLPFGIQRAENPENHHYDASPVKANIKRKFIINSIVTGIVWVIIYILVELDVINFREFFTK